MGVACRRPPGPRSSYRIGLLGNEGPARPCAVAQQSIDDSCLHNVRVRAQASYACWTSMLVTPQGITRASALLTMYNGVNIRADFTVSASILGVSPSAGSNYYWSSTGTLAGSS